MRIMGRGGLHQRAIRSVRCLKGGEWRRAPRLEVFKETSGEAFVL